VISEDLRSQKGNRNVQRSNSRNSGERSGLQETWEFLLLSELLKAGHSYYLLPKICARCSENLNSWMFKLIHMISWLLNVGNWFRSAVATLHKLNTCMTKIKDFPQYSILDYMEISGNRQINRKQGIKMCLIIVLYDTGNFRVKNKRPEWTIYLLLCLSSMKHRQPCRNTLVQREWYSNNTLWGAVKSVFPHSPWPLFTLFFLSGNRAGHCQEWKDLMTYNQTN
jgi:hypothetical protein